MASVSPECGVKSRSPNAICYVNPHQVQNPVYGLVFTEDTKPVITIVKNDQVPMTTARSRMRKPSALSSVKQEAKRNGYTSKAVKTFQADLLRFFLP